MNARPVVLLAVAALACVPRSDAVRETDSTITVLFESDDFVLGPSRDDSPKYLMFLTLVQGYGYDAQPRLAQSWEHSEDYRSWTFHIRSGVTWHDGVPVTAHDVKFTLELYAHPDVLYGDEIAGLESITVPDDHTVVVRWSEPKRPQDVLSGWTVYYPKHLLEALDPREFYEWEFWTRPVGNGPYRFVRAVPQTMMELEANPDFFAGKPAIERVILKLSTANQVIELTSGNADAAYYIRPIDVAKLRHDARFRLYHLLAFSEPQAIHWNQRHYLLADPLVRRALTYAIDRRELLRINNLPDEIPLIGGLSPEDRTARLYREGRLDEGLEYDRESAERLLEQAGWLDNDGDGIREKAGREARFDMLTARGGLSAEESALLIQNHLRHVGVAMSIVPAERAVWRDSYRSGDFDATIFDVPNVPQWLLERDFFGEATKIGYCNPEIVRLLELLNTELDPEVQDTLYSQINDMLQRDVPVTFLYPYFETSVAHRRIRGLSTPDRVNPLEYIDELWIEDER